jgi:hypothetical protein
MDYGGSRSDLMMPLTFVMVCEDFADFEVASICSDRVVCENVEWIDPSIIDSYRCFEGIDRDRGFLTWTQCKKLAKDLGRRAHGHFEGQPGDLDALAGRRAILVALDRVANPAVVFLIRDSDDDNRERINGLGQARSEIKAIKPVIVIGVAHAKREAWVIAGVEPRNDDEHERLERLRHELGFHPCDCSHELTAAHDGDKKSAKRILNELTQGSRDRELSCIRETKIAVLEQRGTDNGLSNYVVEIKERVVPLFTGQPTH